MFDALTQKRPYKAAWPVGEAIAEIDRQRWKQFDPALVDAFLRVIEQREPQEPVTVRDECPETRVTTLRTGSASRSPRPVRAGSWSA